MDIESAIEVAMDKKELKRHHLIILGLFGPVQCSLSMIMFMNGFSFTLKLLCTIVNLSLIYLFIFSVRRNIRIIFCSGQNIFLMSQLIWLSINHIKILEETGLLTLDVIMFMVGAISYVFIINIGLMMLDNKISCTIVTSLIMILIMVILQLSGNNVQIVWCLSNYCVDCLNQSISLYITLVIRLSILLIESVILRSSMSLISIRVKFVEKSDIIDNEYELISTP